MPPRIFSATFGKYPETGYFWSEILRNGKQALGGFSLCSIEGNTPLTCFVSGFSFLMADTLPTLQISRPGTVVRATFCQKNRKRPQLRTLILLKYHKIQRIHEAELPRAASLLKMHPKTLKAHLSAMVGLKWAGYWKERGFYCLRRYSTIYRVEETQERRSFRFDHPSMLERKDFLAILFGFTMKRHLNWQRKRRNSGSSVSTFDMRSKCYVRKGTVSKAEIPAMEKQSTRYAGGIAEVSHVTASRYFRRLKRMGRIKDKVELKPLCPLPSSELAALRKHGFAVAIMGNPAYEEIASSLTLRKGEDGALWLMERTCREVECYRLSTCIGRKSL